ncbi:MAG: BACON domain-containing carbohydrate-binding protein [Rikenellaceae bacterium]
MKRLLFMLLALCLSSCDQIITQEDGDWDDIIKLSTRTLTLDATASSSHITTEGTWWWILENIRIDDEIFMLYSIEDEYIPDPAPSNYIAATFGDPTVNSWSNEYQIIGFAHDWFTITRLSAQELKIDVEENTTGEQRELRIYLEAGNYFDYITVLQASE